MIRAAIVTVGTTATALTDSTQAYGDSSILLQPAAAMFVGPAGVTTSSGFPLASGSQVALDLAQGEALYGVCASGTVAVNVLQTGL